MLAYLISEERLLDADSLGNNENLEILAKSRAKYKIPMLIFLTHSDIYCDKVKKENKDGWKTICKEHFDLNKKNLLEHINELIEKKFKSIFKINENDIMHIVLVDEQNEISDEEALKIMPQKTKDRYKKAKSEEAKKTILETFKDGLDVKENEVIDFLKEEMKVLGQEELIEKIKEKLPSQYHNALNN